MLKTKTLTIESFGTSNVQKCHGHTKNKNSDLLNKVMCDSTVAYVNPTIILVEYIDSTGNIKQMEFANVFSIDYWLEDDYFEVQTYTKGCTTYNQFLKSDVIDVKESEKTMNKEQLYSVYVQFKKGEDAVAMGNKTTTSVEVIGDVLVIEGYYRHGKGKVIYNLNTIKSCSLIPLSEEENKKMWEELEGDEA